MNLGGESVGERKKESKKSRPWPFKNNFSVFFFFLFFFVLLFSPL